MPMFRLTLKLEREFPDAEAAISASRRVEEEAQAALPGAVFVGLEEDHHYWHTVEVPGAAAEAQAADAEPVPEEAL